MLTLDFVVHDHVHLITFLKGCASFYSESYLVLRCAALLCFNLNKRRVQGCFSTPSLHQVILLALLLFASIWCPSLARIAKEAPFASRKRAFAPLARLFFINGLGALARFIEDKGCSNLARFRKKQLFFSLI